MVAAFLTTLFFSLSAASGQRASRILGGTEANFWRLLLAGVLLAAGAHVFGQGLEGAGLPVFLVSGFVGFGIGDLALYQALPRIGSRLSVLLVLCLSAPLAAVTEWLWLGTVLTMAEILAALTILAGVFLALSPGKHLQPANPQFAPGIIFGLLASACQGYGAVLSRKAFALASLAGNNIDGFTAAYQRVLGGIGLAALGLFLVKREVCRKVLRNFVAGQPLLSQERKQLWRKASKWVLVNGISGGVLGVSCMQWALTTTPTGIVLPIIATTPLVIIPFSRYLEGEKPTRRSLFGGFVAVVGAVLLAWVSNPPR